MDLLVFKIKLAHSLLDYGLALKVVRLVSRPTGHNHRYSDTENNEESSHHRKVPALIDHLPLSPITGCTTWPVLIPMRMAGAVNMLVTLKYLFLPEVEGAPLPHLHKKSFSRFPQATSINLACLCLNFPFFYKINFIVFLIKLRKKTFLSLSHHPKIKINTENT